MVCITLPDIITKLSVQKISLQAVYYRDSKILFVKEFVIVNGAVIFALVTVKYL